MKQYKYIIFDIDDTLFDFAQSQRRVMAQLFANEGRELTAKTADLLWALAWECWMKYGLHHFDNPHVLVNYHSLYDGYLHEYAHRIHESGILAASAEHLYRDIPVILSQQREPFDDVVPVLEALHGRVRLALASNGVEAVQKSRVHNLRHYFDEAFISEAIGHVKPDPAFWDIAFTKIDARPDECLMVGDSLQSDIAGAIAYGMDACWLNRPGRENGSGILPTFTIRSLTELI